MRVDEIFTPLVELKHTQNVWDERSGDVVVNVDVRKFDDQWKKTDSQGNFYVGPGGTGAAIKGRYPRFIEFMKSAESYEVPSVWVARDGIIGFTNGRHRYAVMRDQGHKVLPVSMDRESVKNAYKYNLLVKGNKIKEGVPNPGKLRAALMRYIQVVERHGLRAAMSAMQEMGLTGEQANAVVNAYNRYYQKG